MSGRPDGERDDAIDRLRGYLSEPRTMKQLTMWLAVDRRTVFRYLDDIEADGETVSRVGLGRPTRYRLAQ